MADKNSNTIDLDDVCWSGVGDFVGDFVGAVLTVAKRGGSRLTEDYPGATWEQIAAAALTQSLQERFKRTAAGDPDPFGFTVSGGPG